MTLKIAVYAIARDEQAFVGRFCASAKDADLIMIADTGSTDGTLELALANGAIVHSIRISPWRFDVARNTALSLLPPDIDVCVSLDLDEVLQPGWREEIERVWVGGETNRLKYKFDWGQGIAFFYDKVHARHGFQWLHPVHEIVVPDRTEEVWAITEKLLVVHQPDPTKSRAQYLDLLKMSVEEDPRDPRNSFYYCRELSFNAMWEASIEAGLKYLAMPEANWPNERCYAMRVISRCHAELGNHWEAANWARRAVAEAPETREPWCEVAMLAYRAGRWAECYGAACSALAIVNREFVYTCDPAVWGYQAHDLAAISAWWLGMKERALEHALDALTFAPEDERLIANVAMMRGDENNAKLDGDNKAEAA